jgi:hypothetical protein
MFIHWGIYSMLGTESRRPLVFLRIGLFVAIAPVAVRG